MSNALALVAEAEPASEVAAVDIVVPVYNEERDLEPNVRRLRAFLDSEFPLTATVTIADNGSTDATEQIGRRLAHTVKGVRYVRIDRAGRGAALRRCWLSSRSPVVAYMDVDLSTGLEALHPLVAAVASGHSDVAVGSRLAPGARVVRSLRRELVSRTYVALLHALLGLRATDAQCGFKAVRRDAAEDLLPAVEDARFFFDTELLVLAERRGLRIHEVAVDWVEDPDSRVPILKTALEDLAGIWRLLRRREPRSHDWRTA